MPRTRAARSSGNTTTSSPTATAPPSNVPVTTVPKPFTVNTRSIGKRNTPVCARGGERLVDRAAQRGAQLVEALAGRRRHRHDRRALEERPADRGAHVGGHHREPIVVDEIALGQHDHAAPDVEQLADVEVLAGLRHHAFVGGDHQADQVEPGGARDHRLDEPLVARNIDHRDAATLELEPREAELGRDPARLLDRQPIGVGPGERAHERRLAVIDVPGRAEHDRIAGGGGGPAHGSSRSSRFRTLPVGLRGSSGRNVTRRGRL